MPPSKLYLEFTQDKDGVIYKFPERSCSQCVKKPCYRGFEKHTCDKAKYGCIHFKNVDDLC